MRRPIYQTALSCSKLRLKPGCDTEAAGWVSRRRLFKPARMPKSDAPMDARVKWGRMLLDAREARKC